MGPSAVVQFCSFITDKTIICSKLHIIAKKILLYLKLLTVITTIKLLVNVTSFQQDLRDCHKTRMVRDTKRLIITSRIPRYFSRTLQEKCVSSLSPIQVANSSQFLILWLH